MILAGGALLAFGPRSNANTPKGRVVVDYWEKWTGNEAAQMKLIVDDFNETVGKDKGIYVRYISMSNIDQKTRVSTAAGVPPDVAGVWIDNLIQYAAVDGIQPVEDLAREHGLTAEYFKPIYWNSLNWHGHLWGLISTPWCVAMHYNKLDFAANADALRRAGLDPNRPPRTIDELHAYAKVFNTFETFNGQKVIDRAGYLPMEPGWYILETCYWFGGDLFDAKTDKFTLTDPHVVKAFEWIQSYSKELGAESLSQFESGMGGFNSAQNPFLVDKVTMEQQGPWMANYIHDLKPEWSNLRGLSDEQLAKMSPKERADNCAWAAAPFPSAIPGMDDVTYCGYDVLVIPRGAKHKKEAFEFMAFVNTQKEMEKLCKLHCKNSPLAKVSADFIATHPNPYIHVFERLSSSPNAHILPQIPIWPEVAEELNNATQLVYKMKKTPIEALTDSQARLQAKYDEFLRKQKARRAAEAF